MNPVLVAALSVGTWAVVLAPVFARHHFKRRRAAAHPVSPIAPAVRWHAAPRLPAGPPALGERPFDSAVAVGEMEAGR